ncbi:Gfo/Idh/MocA family oxidoreductase [Mycobacterium manitobense]|uniref:Gfo/Idh/MocA family oxidoreductase n=1 Tax=[Mycobacterium] manitobense TaxID=190147 RepID=A0A9X2YC32_9MYCO|nr:Gfo/Idh/MocA family oxidoreductase [[Mycobacterium] manitobense]MCV7171847.1 Gfo/Idh/MocA family oxidoreductase [[Mycobacterium] manitobense]
MNVLTLPPSSQPDSSCLFFGAGNWGRNVITAFTACGATASGFAVNGTASTLTWLSTAHPGVPVSTDPRQLLATDDAPTVVITTPKETHVALAELALSDGRHVFVEKPMALDPADGRRLTAMAENRGLALFTGFTYLYHPAVERLRAAVGPDDVAALRFAWHRPALEGPVEWELLPHDVALAITLTDEIPHAICVSGGGDTARCWWTTSRGATVSIELTGAGPGPKRKQLTLTTASGESWEWSDHRLRQTPDGNRPPGADPVDAQFAPNLPLLREVQWFLDHRTDRRAMRTDMSLSVAVTDLIKRALSTRQERPA